MRRDLGRLVGDQERLVACYQQLGHLYLLVEDYHNGKKWEVGGGGSGR